MWHIQRAIKIWRKDGLRSLITSVQDFFRTIFHRIGYSCRHQYYQIRYTAAAPKPWQLISVDPNQIQTMVVNTAEIPISPIGTRVVSGDWDQNTIDLEFMSQRELRQQTAEPGVTPLTNYGFFRSVRNHFKNGVAWPESEFYQYKLQSGEDGFYESPEAIEQRLSELDRLYDRIQTEGYKSQQELLEDNDENPPLGSPNQSNPAYDEVTIAIGRLGELLFVDGRHRLAVAQLLNVDEIPVRVVGRHSQWQEIRQCAAEDSVPRNIDDNHPDLKELKYC